MPGVDDGAVSVEEAREGLTALAAEGVGSVITTPHLPASVTRDQHRRLRALSAIDKGWDTLRELALQEFPHIWLERGVELLLDHPEPDLSDSRLRLAGTSFVLMEFPHMSIPPHSTLALRMLRSAGWKPIVAHPERYSNFGNKVDLLEAWKDAAITIRADRRCCARHVLPSKVRGQPGSGTSSPRPIRSVSQPARIRPRSILSSLSSGRSGKRITVRNWGWQPVRRWLRPVSSSSLRRACGTALSIPEGVPRGTDPHSRA